MSLEIIKLSVEIIGPLVKSFSRDKIVGSTNYYNECLFEQEKGSRITFVALVNYIPVGAVHLLYRSKYESFLSYNIPEINDLNVISDYQRQGIGTKLVEVCEEYAMNHGYRKIGLGVGLYKDYGRAQRLYFNLGYKPDGLGLMYNHNEVKPGTNTFVDDDLNLYLVKNL